MGVNNIGLQSFEIVGSAPQRPSSMQKNRSSNGRKDNLKSFVGHWLTNSQHGIINRLQKSQNSVYVME